MECRNAWQVLWAGGGGGKRPRRIFCVVLAWGAALALLSPGKAQAQGGDEISAAPSLTATASDTSVAPAKSETKRMPPSRGITVRQAWNAGGWSMWLLAVITAVGLVHAFRLWRSSSASQVSPRGLLPEVLDRVRAGELGEARRLCEDRPCPVAAMALKAFDHLRHTPRAGISLLRDAVDAESLRQADLIASHVQWMKDIAILAPMIGLLGTVLGVLQLCGPTAADPDGAHLALQTGTVVRALSATAFGLLISIPAMMCYAWWRRLATRQSAALKSAATDIVMAVAARFDR